MLKAIPETCRVHINIYLRFIAINGLLSLSVIVINGSLSMSVIVINGSLSLSVIVINGSLSLSVDYQSTIVSSTQYSVLQH
jgi:hypothetical protein